MSVCQHQVCLMVCLYSCPSVGLLSINQSVCLSVSLACLPVSLSLSERWSTVREGGCQAGQYRSLPPCATNQSGHSAQPTTYHIREYTHHARMTADKLHGADCKGNDNTYRKGSSGKGGNPVAAQANINPLGTSETTKLTTK